MWNFKRSPDPDEAIGLIAGQGDFPFLFLEAARSLNKKIIVFGFNGLTDPKLGHSGAPAHFLTLGKLGELLELLKKSKVRQVALAGGIPKKEIYNPQTLLDGEAKEVLGGTANKGDDHLLRAFALYLKARCGISVLDSRDFLKNTLALKGVLTRRAPEAAEMADLRFGWRIVKGIGKMDIGQTVVVKAGVVIAVEALEGTDAAIRRAGSLAGPGGVVVKASKPGQDMRFDLPCVGTETLKSMRAAGCRTLGVESGKTIFLFKEALLREADAENISIVGF